MKNYYAITCIVSFFLIALLPSCTDPTTIGSELQEDVDVFSTDTLALLMSNVVDDSLEMFNPTPQDNHDAYFCGNYNDPIFGRTSASIFSELRVGLSPPDEFYTGTLDSVILHLPYEPLGAYGDVDKSFHLEVFRMTEKLEIVEEIYSNKSYTFDPTPIGSILFTPNVDSSNTIIVPAILDNDSGTLENDTLVRNAHLRIPLEISFGEEFTSLTTDTVLNETSSLRDFLNGIHIRSAQEDDGILAFDLNELVDQSTLGAGITFYYNYPSFTGDTTIYRRHTILTNSEGTLVPKITNATYEPSSEVTTALDQPFVSGDGELYLQGLIGPVVKVEIPNAEDFANTIINKAELTVTVASPDDDNRPTPLQVVLATRNDEGTYLITDDVAFAINRGALSIFGGQEEENGSLRQYTFNLSAVFQDMADGLIKEPLYLQVLLKEEQINRMAIYGPEHSLYPAKLSLVYSTLPE
ncbi:MAG: DUF4270 family protein [Saprospiraceae bacterium]